VGGRDSVTGVSAARKQKEIKKPEQKHLKISRTLRVFLLVLLLRPLRNLSLGWGMRHVSDIFSSGVSGCFRPC
jgi:hypothetical protein